MKLALITDPKGFSLVRQFEFAYHLALVQYVLGEKKYADFYKECSNRGHFVMLDNGAAEDGARPLEDILEAANLINAEEIILPDVMGDADATIEATMDSKVLHVIPPKQRAVVPQGNDLDEWFACANHFMEFIEFSTLCIPKHTERFPGGRVGIVKRIHAMGWHNYHHIHLLGLWDEPYKEISMLRPYNQIIRGLDTAAPFAWAQHGFQVGETVDHISHKWGRKFDKALATTNIETLWSWMWRYE